MRAALDGAARVLALTGRCELAAAILIILVILASIGAQVFSRYVLGTPLIWVEELASYLLIWLGFMAASVAHKQRRHVAIALFGDPKRPALRRALNLIAEVAAITLMAILLANVPAAIYIESRTTSIGLPVDIRRHWFFSVPLAWGAVSLLTTSIYYALRALSSADGAVPPLLGMFGDHEDPDLEHAESVLGGAAASRAAS